MEGSPSVWNSSHFLLGIGGVRRPGTPSLLPHLLQWFSELSLQVLILTFDPFILLPQGLIVLHEGLNFSSKVMLVAVMLEQGGTSRSGCGTGVLPGTGWPCSSTGFGWSWDVAGREVARSCPLARGDRADALDFEWNLRSNWERSGTVVRLGTGWPCWCPGLWKLWGTVLVFSWGKCVWVFGRVLGSKLRPREALALTPSMMYPQGRRARVNENRKQ